MTAEPSEVSSKEAERNYFNILVDRYNKAREEMFRSETAPERRKELDREAAEMSQKLRILRR